MKNSTIAICLSLTTACSSILTGCAETTTTTSASPGASGSSSPVANTSEGLKLGTLLSATGDVASIAAPLPEAVKLAVEKANKCGGVNGKPVTVASEDDQSKPETGGVAMNKLATVDKVAGVVGSFGSAVSDAAAKIGADNKVMLVSPGSTSPNFTQSAKEDKYKGYWARTAPSDVHQAPALAKLAFDKGLKKVAVISIKNPYGTAFEKEFIAAFKKLGGTITNEATPVNYDPKGTTFDTEIKAAMATGQPQGLAAIVYPDETGPLVLKAAYTQGLLKGVQILMPDAGYSDAFPKSVAKTTEGKSILAGAIGTVPGAKGTAYDDFAAAWKTTNKPFTPYLAQSWDAANLMMLAAEAAKSNTGEGIKSKIREVSGGTGDGEAVSDVCKGLELLKAGKKVNYQGASGTVDLDEYGDVLGSYDIWQIQPDNTYKVTGNVAIADPKAKTADPKESKSPAAKSPEATKASDKPKTDVKTGASKEPAKAE
jgi:neutral amino acid transport system substrate-binding protein